MTGARLIFAALFLSAPAVWAADYRAGPDTYREVLSHLRPGDRLHLAPGNYHRGLPLHGMAGAPGQPITIEAADARAMPRFVARAGHNTVSLVDVRYLVLRRLELDGNNVAVDAVKAEGHSRYADFVTLEGLYIHDHAASQQNVGVSTKCPAFGWVIRDLDIEHVGTGLYLGDSDGSAPFVAGLIEGNRISRTLGYNVQIKHQTARPAGPPSRHDTLIRFNVLVKRESVRGPFARPNLLLGHFPLQGAGAADRYLVYGNLFLDNPTEALVQAEGRVALYDNVFINAGSDAIHIQPHNAEPHDIDIFSNTILASGNGIRVVAGASRRYRQRVTANLVSAARPLEGGESRDNMLLAYRADWLDIDPVALGAHMLAGRHAAAVGRIELSSAAYPGWERPVRAGARVHAGLLRTLERTR